MHVKEAVEQRRSIKHFDSNHVITEKELNELLSHAILSPTAFNIQNWRFVVVTDKALRQKIRAELEACHDNTGEWLAPDNLAQTLVRLSNSGLVLCSMPSSLQPIR